MALALADEFKRLPRLLRSWPKRIGLPRSPQRGWGGVVKNLVIYLSPFFPITVQRKKATSYRYIRDEKRASAVSTRAYQVVAEILHLAYPLDWPQPNAKRVSNFYHSA